MKQPVSSADRWQAVRGFDLMQVPVELRKHGGMRSNCGWSPTSGLPHCRPVDLLQDERVGRDCEHFGHGIAVEASVSHHERLALGIARRF